MIDTPNGKARFDISLEDLQTFLAVADLGSFSRAAKHLNLSQPSISNRIRRLEEKLDVLLLTRTTRKVEVTTHGKRLHVQAALTLGALTSLLQEFRAETGHRRHRVNIAATMMVATVALPPIVRAFADERPSISVRIKDYWPDKAMAAVIAGDCDLAVMAPDGLPANAEFELLASDSCVVVTPLGHPLLRCESAALSEVLAYPLLSPDGHVGLRRAINSAAEQRGLQVKLAPEARGLTNNMTLLAMAVAGLGICIHPPSMIPAELRTLVGRVRLHDCEIVRNFGIVTACNRQLTAPARFFRDYLRQTMSTVGPL